MESKPFISVVIPTHNRLVLLKQTLACLAQQSYPSDRYEVIVVDNGSEDGTADYLRQLADQGRLHYIRQRPLGPAVARNVGARAACGEVVVFTDDDCLPEAGWLAALAESYIPGATPLAVAVGGRVENVSDGHWLHRFYAAQGNRHRANHLERPAYLDTANASFRRSVFLAVGGFSEHFSRPCGEDVDLGFRLVAAGYELHTDSQAVVWHVGRTSLWGMMRQSFDRGRGNAFLKTRYPERFASAPSQGLRLQIKRLLDHLLRLAWQAPHSVRPITCGLAAALRSAAFAVPETEYFVLTHLRKQVSRYRAQAMMPFQVLLYVLLEWCDYLLQQVGQVAGTFSYTHRQIRVDPEVL
jgi:glycosyltransferase involved in cell wall biosynthesis